MLPLSSKTEFLVSTAFCESTDAYRREIVVLLETEIGQNIPFCEEASPEDMERIRFAVIRLIAEDNMCQSAVIQLARTDWRDLLMAAEFAYNPGAHIAWYFDFTRDRGHQSAAPES